MINMAYVAIHVHIVHPPCQVKCHNSSRVFLGVFRAIVVRKFAGNLEFLEKFLEFSHEKWSFTKKFLNFRTKTRVLARKILEFWNIS